MTRIIRIVSRALWVALPAGSLLAQEFKFQPEVNSIPVAIHGVKVHSPFTGGFSFSKTALGDIDADGDPDLFVGDSFGGISFYENAGSVASPSFVLQTDNLASINVGRDIAPALVDIDHDGDLDLFIGEEDGNINFARNDGTPIGYQFVFVTDAFDSIDIGLSSAPAFADIDNDGDDDLFVGGSDGTVHFYRNAGNATAPDFVLEAENLGGINVGRDSTPALWDIDNDGDFDLFVGEDGGDINFFRNTGSSPDTSFTLEEEKFAGINIGTDSAPAFADLDGDLDADLLVAEFLGNVNHYRNDGSVSQPDFVLQIENFAAIDVGTNSTPSYVDIDGDGDLDLFVGKNTGELNFYRNAGTKAAPSFQLETENYLADNGDPDDVGSFSIPAFADIDGDGDQDLFVGEFDGFVNLYLNTGTSSAPKFELAAGKLGGIDVGQNSAPALTDIDDDGDVDLFVGARDGFVYFFVNAGKSFDSTFSSIGEKFESIDVGDDAIPFFIDVDKDGDQDLFIGKDRGAISFYRNMGTASAPAFPASDATGSFASIDIGNDSSPALADIDNDGDVDLFVGEREGGLYFYRRIPGTTSVSSPELNIAPQDFVLAQNYPNPFNPGTTIEYNLPKTSRVTLAIYNLLGQRIATLIDAHQTAGQHAVRWDGKDDLGKNAASGIFFYRLEAGGLVTTRRLVLLR
jgi:hypothetical protein